MLTDVTIGSYTSAVALDWLGGDESEPAAQRLIGLGLLSTAADRHQRLLGLGRHRGRRTTRCGGSASSTPSATSRPRRCSPRAGSPAAAATTAAGRRSPSPRAPRWAAPRYLGGHLTLAEGVGVDHTVFEDGPEDWTSVLDDGELGDGQMRCVEADGTAVMVARAGGNLYALSDHCSHRGGPLHEGTLDATARSRARGTTACSTCATARWSTARPPTRSRPGTRASETGASRSAAGSLMRRARASPPAAASWTADRRRRGGARRRAHPVRAAADERALGRRALPRARHPRRPDPGARAPGPERGRQPARVPVGPARHRPPAAAPGAAAAGRRARRRGPGGLPGG